MKLSKIFCLISLFILACVSVHAEVIPEMKECMEAHTSPDAYRAVLQRYCEPAVVQKAMSLLVIPDPYIVRTEKEGNVICYTVRGRTVATAHEIFGESIQIYKVWWIRGKVIALRFLGPGAITSHTGI